MFSSELTLQPPSHPFGQTTDLLKGHLLLPIYAHYVQVAPFTLHDSP